MHKFRLGQYVVVIKHNPSQAPLYVGDLVIVTELRDTKDSPRYTVKSSNSPNEWWVYEEALQACSKLELILYGIQEVA